MAEILYPDESYQVQGALFGVYKEKGCGFLEAVYRLSLADEHRAQLHNHLRATKMRLGIPANFGHHPKLQYERIAL